MLALATKAYIQYIMFQNLYCNCDFSSIRLWFLSFECNPLFLYNIFNFAPQVLTSPKKLFTFAFLSPAFTQLKVSKLEL